MDMNTLNGILRAIVPAGLAYAAGKGVIPAGAEPDIMAAVSAVVAALWSVFSNRPAAK